ncbi:extracellular solute-binding protein, partial [[Clostridium] symbiosum]|uniref:extracellular solute-binding protein n=1 Tax=Clostridium symbiosum TaxID=1512 RepID=UPI00210D182A
IPNVDVTELVDEINEKRPYFDSVYEGDKYGGVNYFVPFTSSTCLMFVRTDMLEAKGITKYPETWDEVFEVAENVADPDNGIYGLGIGCGPTDEDCENTFRTLLWNYGAYLFNEEGGSAVPNEKTKAMIEKYA